MSSSGIRLAQIDDSTRADLFALRVTPSQLRFVGSVQDALNDAAAYPHANPWPRAVLAGDRAVGFVMLSWNVVPQPPDLIGPWFLWKLLIDESHQGKGYGRAVVQLVADLVRAEGAVELLTSYVDEEGGPAGFYRSLGFEPTGEVDGSGEVIVRLRLRDDA